MEWALPAVVVFCLFSVAVSIGALVLAVLAKIDIEAFKKSTHNIQFVPVDPNADANDAAAARAMDQHDIEAMRDLGKIHSQYSQGEI